MGETNCSWACAGCWRCRPLHRMPHAMANAPLPADTTMTRDSRTPIGVTSPHAPPTLNTRTRQLEVGLPLMAAVATTPTPATMVAPLATVASKVAVLSRSAVVSRSAVGRWHRDEIPVQHTDMDSIVSRQAARRGEACASQLASPGVRAHGGARTHLSRTLPGVPTLAMRVRTTSHLSRRAFKGMERITRKQSPAVW